MAAPEWERLTRARGMGRLKIIARHVIRRPVLISRPRRPAHPVQPGERQLPAGLRARGPGRSRSDHGEHGPLPSPSRRPATRGGFTSRRTRREVKPKRRIRRHTTTNVLRRPLETMRLSGAGALRCHVFGKSLALIFAIRPSGWCQTMPSQPSTAARASTVLPIPSKVSSGTETCCAAACSTSR